MDQQIQANDTSPTTEMQALLAEAQGHQRAGRFGEAENLYRQILTQTPGHPGALFRLGLLCLQRTDAGQAIEWIDQACAAEPGNANFLCARGLAQMGLGQCDQAIESYQKAASLDSHLAEAPFGVGTARQAKGELNLAAAAYRQAIAINSDHIPALINLGNILQVQGNALESVENYQRVIKIEPTHVEAWNNMGSALDRLNRLADALDAFHHALSVRPDFLPARNNLANVLVRQGEYDKAISLLRDAVQTNPQYVEAWYNLGNAYSAASNFTEAEAAYRKALSLQPNNLDALSNLGTTLYALGKYALAQQIFLKVTQIRRHDGVAFNNLGNVRRKLGDLDGAVIIFRHTLGFQPDHSPTWCNLANVWKDKGDLDQAVVCFAKAIELNPQDAISHSNLVYCLSYSPTRDPAAILDEGRRYNDLHARALADQIAQHTNDRSPQRRLRIGYVSPDFREHCQSFFTIPLLSHHDHGQFEIFAYSSVAHPDAITQRISQSVDVWRDVTSLNDAKLSQVIRDDKIDILVDLTMHMANGRPLTMARKPAPVQVAYLAYPGTTGINAIDYRLTDPYLDPPGQHDIDYSEQSIRLPHTFWCYDPLTSELEPNELPALKAGRITFGCLNNFCKVTEATLELWARAMAQVPDSQLILMAPTGSHRNRLLEQMGRLGIDSARIEFLPFQPRPKYLQTYHRIDLGLDTIPYNGHTTSLDSYWMGVPVVTRLGQTVVGRAGWSQLSNLDLTELCATSDDQFVQIVTEWCNDLPRLSQLRGTLRDRLHNSPLGNAQQFARDIEAAYRQMWQNWISTSSS